MKPSTVLTITLTLFACTSRLREHKRHPTRLPPTLTLCGESPTIVGNDLIMRVTTHADHCSITFVTPFEHVPRFYVANEYLVPGVTYSVSATGIELDGPAGTYEIATTKTAQ